MCGITGFLDFFRRSSLEQSVLRMTDTLHHRGPDDSGIWYDQITGIALGHRRLAILDLSPAGHQPMHSACGRYVLVFNGEIYNHLAIRKKLPETNYQVNWRGHSDTETLLAAFVQWGIKKTLQATVGMFALAVWDRQQKKLTLARDRMGEKPLYYGWQGNTFLFASELKAIKAHPAFKADIDRDALTLFLRYNYIPTPFSIYQGIAKLPPGTFLDLPFAQNIEQARAAQPEAYWSLRNVVNGTANQGGGSSSNPLSMGDGIKDDDAISALEQCLGDAVAGQQLADVPLGAFLSGGVDSSLIVALMQARAAQPVRTFSIGFDEAEHNEAEYASAVARHLGTDHTELYVSPAQARAVIPLLPTLYDEPFADSSQIPTFLVCQQARQHVTVALSGDGGDELYGGYNRYLWAPRIWKKLGWLPYPIRQQLAHLMVALHPLSSNIQHVLPQQLRVTLFSEKLEKLGQRLDGVKNLDAFYHSLVSEWRDPANLVRHTQEPQTLLTSPSDWPELANVEQRMMYLDTLSYLPDDILCKVDRAAMGVSLETRVPFLDHRVVELAWRLPLTMKIRGGQGKWILRQLLYRHVPKELIERPKQGFSIPLAEWLRGPLREWAETLLDESRLQREGYFYPDLIRQRWQQHLSGKRNWQHSLWSILMFQAWLETQQKS